jgi:DNA repair exonuclease SbcCD ATPase subunit
MNSLKDLVLSLTPIHEAMAAHEKGGPACARTIERIHRQLSELKERLEDVDDLRSDLESAEERIEELEEELAQANNRLLKAGLEGGC